MNDEDDIPDAVSRSLDYQVHQLTAPKAPKRTIVCGWCHHSWYLHDDECTLCKSIHKHCYQKQPANPPEPQKPIVHLTIEQIRPYLNKKLTQTEIARHLGVRQARISLILKQTGIKYDLRPKFRIKKATIMIPVIPTTPKIKFYDTPEEHARKIKRVIELRKQGKPYKDIEIILKAEGFKRLKHTMIYKILKSARMTL